MTTTGKDFPVRSDAFRFSSETRASSAATSPACTECFDIFPAKPGDSDVINQMERLSSKEMKIAARLVWMAVGASCRSATVGYGWHARLQSRCSQPHSARALVAIHLPMGSVQIVSGVAALEADLAGLGGLKGFRRLRARR